MVGGQQGRAPAGSPFQDAEYVAAGKTGTAQVIGIKQNEKYDAEQDRRALSRPLAVRRLRAGRQAEDRARADRRERRLRRPGRGADRAEGVRLLPARQAAEGPGPAVPRPPRTRKRCATCPNRSSPSWRRARPRRRMHPPPPRQPAPSQVAAAPREVVAAARKRRPRPRRPPAARCSCGAGGLRPRRPRPPPRRRPSRPIREPRPPRRRRHRAGCRRRPAQAPAGAAEAAKTRPRRTEAASGRPKAAQAGSRAADEGAPQR